MDEVIKNIKERKELIDMNEEEKKAIKKIEQLVEYLKKWNKNFTVTPEDVKYFEKVLEMVKTYARMTNEGIEEILEYEEELEKKDKIINKLIGLLTGKGLTAWDNEKKQLIHAQEILDYFTNLVEKENK